jgi:hypothetical protein
MKKVLELQLSLWGSCNFKAYTIYFVLHSYFEHYTNNGGMVIQFHIKKFVHMDEQIKRLNSKQKKNYAHF